MKRKLALLLLSTLLFSFYACKKDKQAEIIKNKLTLLTSKSWKPSFVDKTPDNIPIGEHVYIFDWDCQRNDSYTFRDNKLTIVPAANNCFLYPQPQEEKSLSIDMRNNKLIINGIPHTIAEISETQLKYYTNFPFPNGPTIVIFIFEH